MVRIFLAKDKGKSPLPKSYLRYKICERMGWDIHTYRAQPVWFIEQILEFSNIEAEYQNREIERS